VVEEGVVVTAEAGFMAAEAFTAGVVSEAFAVGVLEAFTAAALETFAVGVFLAPVLVSTGTRGGGIGVIRITPTITQVRTTVTMRTTAIRTVAIHTAAIRTVAIHTAAIHTVALRTTAIRTTERVMPALPLRCRSKPHSPGVATIEVPLMAS
jgi:hypothetical protein